MQDVPTYYYYCPIDENYRVPTPRLLSSALCAWVRWGAGPVPESISSAMIETHVFLLERRVPSKIDQHICNTEGTE